jgi:DNA invertase Pin-like site-specific DNA recombinase
VIRAVIYTRVSQDRVAGKRSVGEQEAECRTVATDNGWTVVKVFTDNDRSASRYAKKVRPAFAELLAFIEAGNAEVLMTWESSRASRDLSTFLPLREALINRRMTWTTADGSFDLSKASDRKRISHEAVDNEHESGRTSERVQRSVRANAAKGRPHGRFGFGYRRVYTVDGHGRKSLTAVVEHEQEAAILREIAERFLAGESFYAIGRDLSDRRVPAPHGAVKWYGSNLRRLMANPTYHGQRTHHGAVVGPAIWPAIFDDTTWFQLQARLADPARRAHLDPNGTARLRREGAVRHLLSGIARCGVCGARMMVGNNRGIKSYYCKQSFHTARREDLTDQVVVDIILARLNKPDVLQLLADNDDHTAVRDAVAEADGKRARLETFIDAAADGSITAAALARIETKLMAEIDAAQTRARRASSGHVLDQAVGIDRAQWDALPIATRREIITAICDVTIMPAGRGHRTFDPTLIKVRRRAE